MATNKRSGRVQLEGQGYDASYTVDGPVITVSSVILGTRCARIEHAPPDALAKIILAELFFEEQERRRQ